MGVLTACLWEFSTLDVSESGVRRAPFWHFWPPMTPNANGGFLWLFCATTAAAHSLSFLCVMHIRYFGGRLAYPLLSHYLVEHWPQFCAGVFEICKSDVVSLRNETLWLVGEVWLSCSFKVKGLRNWEHMFSSSLSFGNAWKRSHLDTNISRDRGSVANQWRLERWPFLQVAAGNFRHDWSQPYFIANATLADFWPPNKNFSRSAPIIFMPHRYFGGQQLVVSLALAVWGRVGNSQEWAYKCEESAALIGWWYLWEGVRTNTLIVEEGWNVIIRRFLLLWFMKRGEIPFPMMSFNYHEARDLNKTTFGGLPLAWRWTHQ